VNPQFRDVAEANRYFGLTEADLWKNINANHKSVRAIPEISKDVQDLFATAHDVSFEHHIAVQAAFQKFTDNAVSKTINCPNETTKEDIGRAYMLGYDLGVKGLTVYRDGSKTHQVLNIAPGGGSRRARSSRRPSSEHGSPAVLREDDRLWPLHVNIVYDERGPFRVFANIPPLGTEIAGLTAVIGILLSKYLETGGKAEKILKHLNSVKGDKPLGFGPNRVESIPHALSQILREHLKKHGHLTLNGNGNGAVTANPESRAPEISESATCPKCYSTNVEFVSGCKEPTCFDCGY
jgi:ribonucleoside-diphosphate reductase alpha chain